MDCDVLKLFLYQYKRSFVRSSVQVRKERDHVKALCEKKLLFIDANASSVYLSSIAAT